MVGRFHLRLGVRLDYRFGEMTCQQLCQGLGQGLNRSFCEITVFICSFFALTKALFSDDQIF